MKRMETSKLIAFVITAIFGASLFAGIILKCFGHDIKAFVDIALVAESVVLGGYFGKAGFENVAKINNTTYENVVFHDNEGSEL